MVKMGIKNFLLAAIAIMCCGLAKAQLKINDFRAEIGGSLIYSVTPIQHSTTKPSGGFFIEARYNPRKSPVDVGFHFGSGSFRRQWDSSDTIRYSYTRSTKYTFSNYLVVCDYNFRQGKDISYFAGLGLGFSHRKIVETSPRFLEQPVQSSNSFCGAPRIGVEFFRIVRLTASYKMMKSNSSYALLYDGIRDFNYWDVSLGFVIGGWKKPQ